MTEEKQQIVISGGGPGGLAAALLFADLGWKEIILVERRPSPSDFEKNKAFNYQIDPRGQKLLKRLGIDAMLDEYGVANRDFTLTTIKPNGEVSVASPPIIDPERETSYWTTRRNFLTMLHKTIEERNDQRIRLLYNHSFQGIRRGPDGKPEITILDLANNEPHIFRPNILLACDGLGSQVHQS